MSEFTVYGLVSVLGLILYHSNSTVPSVADILANDECLYLVFSIVLMIAFYGNLASLLLVSSKHPEYKVILLFGFFFLNLLGG